MADQQKKSIEVFLTDLRSEVDIPEGMSDSDLMKKLMASPKGKALLQKEGVELSEMRSKMKGSEKGIAGRFAEGLADPLVSGVQGLIKGGFDSAQRGKDLQTKEGRVKGSLHAAAEGATAPFKAMAGVAKDPSQLVNAESFWKDMDKENYAGAAGQFTGQVGQWAGPFLGKGGAATAGSEIEKFTAMTERITAPIAETLSSQAEAIKAGMTGQLSNVAALRGNPMFRKLTSRLGTLETAPETAKGAVTAAKDAVEQIANTVNSGKATGWTDLFEMNKKLNTAGAAIKDPATKAMLRKLTDTVNDELSAGAGRAGMGKAYDAWRGNYAKFSSLRRTYDDILKGKTDTQLERKATAKSTKMKVLGTDIGSPKVNKIAKGNTSMIKQAHKAFDELHGQIKSSPKPSKVPPAASPTAPAGSAPPTIGGGSGTFERTPRMNPVEHPTPPPAPIRPTPKSTPIPTEPKWPANYQGAPQSLDSSGKGGANYSAADLDALKKKHDIK